MTTSKNGSSAANAEYLELVMSFLTPPALPEIGREAPATVCAPLVVSFPWRVTARCPIVDPDLAPGRSAIPVLVAAMVLTARRLLRFLVLGPSNSVLRLRRARGRDRCLARPRRIVALGAGAGGEKCRVYPLKELRTHRPCITLFQIWGR